MKYCKQAGVQRRTPPTFDTSCSLTQVQNGLSPQITSPSMQLSYVVRANSLQKMQIPFSATTDADVATVHWFVNEMYVGEVKRDQLFLWNAQPDKYVVRVVDDHGRADARELVVRVES